MVFGRCSIILLYIRWLCTNLDGIRLYWDGQRFFSKQGKEIIVPLFFTKDFPSIPLDGEIWMEHGNKEDILRLLRSTKENWDNSVKYRIFDLPSSVELFEHRMASLQELSLPAHVEVAKILQCNGLTHLEEVMDSARGSEIIARAPQTLYITGHSSSILILTVCKIVGNAHCLAI
jgi:DNA ligase-1